jgi:DNA helicase-2/ATP-dependent DNA helicase PcrA
MEYRSQWAGSPSEQDIQHLANIDEFVNAAQQFDATAPEQATIEGFLETTALVADVDSVDAAAERVTLMTLHAAKGLEFPVVYLIGLEQQILPHERALRSESSNEYEEERRLLFVGMTRARERLILTRAGIRPLRGRSLITIPSDFLREIGVAETVVPSTRPSRLADPGDEAHPIPPPEWDEAHETFPTEDEPGAQPHGASKSSQITEPGARRHPLLMTGADLLSAGSAPPTDLPAGFRVGMSVRHPRYGVGRIIKTSGFAKNRTVTVEFQDDGRSETFIASRNPLQPVGNG